MREKWSLMRDRLTVVALAIVAIITGVFLAAPTHGGEIIGLTADPPGFPWGSTGVAIAGGLVGALAVCVGARRILEASVVGAVAAVALLIAVAIAALPAIAITVAAGVVLGSALQLARTVPGRAADLAVVTGAVVGVIVAPMLSAVRAELADGPRRYADYVPHESGLLATGGARVDAIAAAVAVIGVAVVVVANRSRFAEHLVRPPLSSIVATVGIVIAGALTEWWFRRFLSETLADNETTGLHTFHGGYVAIGLVLVTALVLRGRGRLLWIAAAAGTVAIATDGTSAKGWSLTIVTTILLVVAAIVTALVVRRSPPLDRARGVPIAVAVLAAFAATQFITDEFWSVVPALVGAFGVPVAVAMAVAAAVVATVPDQATVVGAIAVLTLLRLTTGTDFGWTAYTPLSDASGFDGITGETVTTSQAAVGVIVLTACFATAISLSRRASG